MSPDRKEKISPVSQSHFCTFHSISCFCHIPLSNVSPHILITKSTLLLPQYFEPLLLSLLLLSPSMQHLYPAFQPIFVAVLLQPFILCFHKPQKQVVVVELLSAAAVWQPSLVVQPVSYPCVVWSPLRRIHIFKYTFKGRNGNMHFFLVKDTNKIKLQNIKCPLFYSPHFPVFCLAKL